VATHDYVIANGTGAAVRSDLNGALAAIVSNNSSATQPATMYAYQWWADTTTGLLKIRNSANSAWVTLFQLDGEWSTLPIENGTAAAPSIYFKDSGTDTGFYSPGADQIGITTGGTSRIVVDASGNVNIDSNTLYVDAANNRVGLGTSGPNAQSQLHVVGSGYQPLYLNTTAAGGGGATFFRSDVQALYVGTGGSSWLSGSSTADGLIRSEANLIFGIGNSEKARIDSSGRLGIATTTPGALLHAAGKIRFGSNASFYGEIDHDAASTGANIYNHSDSGGHIFQNAGTEQLKIDGSGRLLVGIIASPANQLQVSTDSAGKPSTSTWTIVSDERIKEDIELADLDLCYEAIKAIPLKRYKWRDEIYTAEQVTDRRKLGWIAQDVETVFPKAVGTHEFKYNQVFEETIIPAVEEELDADGNVITPAQPERTEQGDLISEDVIEDCRNLNSDQIYAAMYGAVQKLMAKVEALEASNADLLARVTALEAA